MKSSLLLREYILTSFFLFLMIPCRSQEDSARTTVIAETFLSTRIINGHSVETIKKQQLEFRVSHRFGQVNEGIDQFFGLDHGTIHLGLEYGLKDWLEIGLGRSTVEKTVDGFAKASIIRQSEGSFTFPFHITYLASMEWVTLKRLKTTNPGFSNRLSYIHQAMIARKFNENLSVQLSPTFIHRNLVPVSLEKNDLFSLGMGARYKISRWVALTVEYFLTPRSDKDLLPTRYYNPLSIGVDIDTGSGHVFQIMLTNSQAMREGGFIGKTTGAWDDGGIHLGFNISRLFSFATE